MSTHVQTRVKVALVDLDGQPFPIGFRRALEREGIELLIRQCNTRAELAQHAQDADIVWLFGGSRVLHGGSLDGAALLGHRPDGQRHRQRARRGGNGSRHRRRQYARGAERRCLRSCHRACSWRSSAGFPGRSGGARGIFDQTLASALEFVPRPDASAWSALATSRGDVARKLSGFGMKWLVHDPFVSADELAAQGFQPVSLEAFSCRIRLRLAALSAHAFHPASDRRAAVALMKPTAILINTVARPCRGRAGASRGPSPKAGSLPRASTSSSRSRQRRTIRCSSSTTSF